MSEKPSELNSLEKCIICRCMEMSPAEIISSGLKPDDFADNDHAMFYSAIINAHTSGNDCDLPTIGALIDPTKIQKLMSCSEYKTSQNMEWMIKSIKNASKFKRDLKKIYDVYHDAIQAFKDNPTKEFSLAEKLSFIAESETASNITESFSGGLLRKTIESIEKDYANGGVTAIKTGVTAIDEILAGGLKPKKLITIAARPGVGKTALATNMFYHACNNGHNALYITIELDSVEITERLICIDSEINTEMLASRRLLGNHIDKIANTMNKMHKWQSSVNSQTGGSWEKAAMTIYNQAKYKGVKLVFIDYVQQFRTENKRATMRENITEITSRCKTMAMDLDICIVMIAQLNRDIDKRSDKDPINSDLKESGSIEQDSDAILMLAQKTDDVCKDEKNLFCYVTKNRQGQTGFFKIKADLSINKFYPD